MSQGHRHGQVNGKWQVNKFQAQLRLNAKLVRARVSFSETRPARFPLKPVQHDMLFEKWSHILFNTNTTRYAVGCISQSGGRDGRIGRWTPCKLCPVQLGGPAARASSPHTGPTPQRGVALLAARRRGSSELSQAMNRTPAALMAQLLHDSAQVVADSAGPRPTNAPARQYHLRRLRERELSGRLRVSAT